MTGKEEQLKEIEELDKKIKLLELSLNSLFRQRKNKIQKLFDSEGAYKKPEAKTKAGYYNVDVERPESIWKGREHN
jgi:hypothetical protein